MLSGVSKGGYLGVQALEAYKDLVNRVFESAQELKKHPTHLGLLEKLWGYEDQNKACMKPQIKTPDPPQSLAPHPPAFPPESSLHQYSGRSMDKCDHKKTRSYRGTP